MATTNYFKVKNGLEFPSIETLQTTDNTGPSIKPVLNLDFAKTKTLDPRITFSRASTATYYDGKTTVKAEENLQTYSQDFSYWSLSGGLLSHNVVATTAPDGTQTAAKLYEDANSGAHRTYFTAGTTLGQTATFSVYLKAAERKHAYLRVTTSDSTLRRAYFDLENGVVGDLDPTLISSSITYVRNNWYRCSVTFIASTTTQTQVLIGVTRSTRQDQESYLGDGSSGVYIWGAQVEHRPYASTYTPTTSSAITNYIPALQTVIANTARFEHDPITGESKGLLVEESRTNLVSSSENFKNWSVYQQSQTESEVIQYQNAAIAPNGASTATKLVEVAGTSAHRICMWNTVSLSAGSYTFSVYAKAAERSWLFIQNPDAAGSAYINISTGAIGSLVATTATATQVGNGWYRVTMTGSIASPSSAFRIFFGIANADGGVTYGGDGKSGLYIWGAQLETGAFATSYIPTLLTHTGRGSTATYRSADGTIRTAQLGVARYEPNAASGNNLVLESAASNLVTYTNSLSSFAASQLNAVKNAAIAPDGSTTSTQLVESSTNTEHSYTQTFTSGSNTTISLFVKAGSRTKIGIGLTGTNPASTGIVFDTSTNTFSAPGSTWLGAGWVAATNYGSTPVGGGWYRIWMNYPGLSTGRFDIYMIGASSNERTYTGDGASSIYVWGAQYEIGVSYATSYIPSIETWTGRSSTASYYDSTGTLRTTASGVARYSYNPSNIYAEPKLLLESAATNLLLQTADVTNAAWSVANATKTTGTTAPDGTSLAIKFAETGIAGYHEFYQQLASAVTGTYTASIYAKEGERNLIQMGPLTSGFAAGSSAIFNLTTGTVVSTRNYGTSTGVTASIQSVGQGWYRCSVTTTNAVAQSLFLDVMIVTGTSTINYTGTAGSGVYLWGPQLEAGYAASSYISTTSATVTRAADTSTSAAQSRAADTYAYAAVTRAADATSISGTNFTSWWKKNEGTLYAEGTPVHPTTYTPNAMLIGTMAGTYQGIELRYSGTDTANIRCENVYNNSSNSSLSVSASGARTRKIAYAFAPGDLAATCNAATPATNSITNIDNSTIAYIGYTPAYSSAFNGTIRKIAYYPKRLSNAELVSITS